MGAATQKQSVDTVTLPDVVSRYFQAWNAHSPDAVLAALAPTGSYSDPTTNGPLTGEAMVRYLEGFFTAFPDVAFEVASAAEGGGRVTVEWLMRGTNRGPLLSPLTPNRGGDSVPTNVATIFACRSRGRSFPWSVVVGILSFKPPGAVSEPI